MRSRIRLEWVLLTITAAANQPRVAGAQRSASDAPPWPPYSAPMACTAARGDARAALDRAWHAAGLDRLQGQVVHYQATDIVQQNYQSDRPYPPFFSVPLARDVWFDPDRDVERGSAVYGALFDNAHLPTTVDDGSHLFVVSDTSYRAWPDGRMSAVQSRPLNAWAALADFRRSPDAHVVARCSFRDYPRLAIARTGVWGEERLLLDESTGLPVALVREEPHYLWGQQQVAYVYSLWDRAGASGARRPRSAIRLTDGVVEIERLDGAWNLEPQDSMPPVPAPDTARASAPVLPVFLQALPVDTMRLGHVWYLHNAGYAEAMTMIGDTVYVMDATQGDARARLDSAWMAALYPRHRAVVVVVTDLAWPHIAGVRFWVARGATIVSHRASEPMLRRVVERRWTRTPDALEQARRAGHSPAFRYRDVDDSLTLAGGAIRLVAIDGVASQGALMAFMPGDGVLWASDFVQTLKEPTEYAREVWDAAQRHGLQPVTVAAEHLPPSPWARLARLVSP